MKKTKFLSIASLLLMGVFCITSVSCGSDDDEPETKQETTATGTDVAVTVDNHVGTWLLYYGYEIWNDSQYEVNPTYTLEGLDSLSAPTLITLKADMTFESYSPDFVWNSDGKPILHIHGSLIPSLGAEELAHINLSKISYS